MTMLICNYRNLNDFFSVFSEQFPVWFRHLSFVNLIRSHVVLRLVTVSILITWSR